MNLSRKKKIRSRKNKSGVGHEKNLWNVIWHERGERIKSRKKEKDILLCTQGWRTSLCDAKGNEMRSHSNRICTKEDEGRRMKRQFLYFEAIHPCIQMMEMNISCQTNDSLLTQLFLQKERETFSVLSLVPRVFPMKSDDHHLDGNKRVKLQVINRSMDFGRHLRIKRNWLQWRMRRLLDFGK